MAKKQGYKFGVSWIALNDEPGELDLDSISGYISVALLADLFGKTTKQVGQDVLDFRILKELDNAKASA